MLQSAFSQARRDRRTASLVYVNIRSLGGTLPPMSDPVQCILWSVGLAPASPQPPFPIRKLSNFSHQYSYVSPVELTVFVNCVFRFYSDSSTFDGNGRRETIARKNIITEINRAIGVICLVLLGGEIKYVRKKGKIPIHHSCGWTLKRKLFKVFS